MRNIFRQLLFGLKILFRFRGYDYSKSCNFCLSNNTKLIQRKYLLLQLRKCNNCNLMFRYPKDSILYSEFFYTNIYRQENDLTTSLPDLDELEEFKKSNFRNSGKNFFPRIEMLKRVTSKMNSCKLLEYGSSWGYFLYQAGKAGFDCCGIEISKKRAMYGVDNLGIKIYTDSLSICDNSFDVIYLCHVIEHITDLQSLFDFINRVLCPKGIAVIECPNCDSEEAKEQGIYWGPMIGEIHLNALTPQFFCNAFARYNFDTRITTLMEEVDELDKFFDKPQQCYSLQATNLIVIARRKS